MELKFKLGELPFSSDSFEPKLSAESFSYHYDKHHRAYVQNLNQFLDEETLSSYKVVLPNFFEENNIQGSNFDQQNKGSQVFDEQKADIANSFEVDKKNYEGAVLDDGKNSATANIKQTNNYFESSLSLDNSNKYTITDKALIHIVKASYICTQDALFNIDFPSSEKMHSETFYSSSKTNLYDIFLFKNVFLERMANNPQDSIMIENNKALKIDKLRLDAALTKHKRIFNNAAQHWNHAFFWESIRPSVQDIPSKLAFMIEKKWQTIKNFEKCFYDNAAALFGSGWIWLVYNKISEDLDIVQTMNAETPILTDTLVPLLCCDAWEHAYYIDYRNKRVDYLSQIISLLNWQFAQENLDRII